MGILCAFFFPSYNFQSWGQALCKYKNRHFDKWCLITKLCCIAQKFCASTFIWELSPMCSSKPESIFTVFFLNDLVVKKQMLLILFYRISHRVQIKQTTSLLNKEVNRVYLYITFAVAWQTISAVLSDLGGDQTCMLVVSWSWMEVLYPAEKSLP